MHSSRPTTTRLRGALLAFALLCAPAAFAGPPLLCHPFETAGAPSLPWGSGWNQPARNYTTTHLSADTLRLLARDTPIIARMETLRRAAIYASGDGVHMRDLAAKLDARVATAKDPTAKALALFDAGYFAETLQDLERLQGYDMPGIGRIDASAVHEVLSRGDGSERIAQALVLRPRDSAMRFASALVASADRRQADYAMNARLARAGVRSDRLLALNLDKIRD
jgi:hypothetical protein